jgi:hypothetical protein
MKLKSLFTRLLAFGTIRPTPRKEGTRMYTAAVLSPTSAQLLKWIMRGTIALEGEGFVTETAQGHPLPHHMTINMGNLDSSLNPKAILGEPVILEIDRLVYNYTLGVCAAKVTRAAHSYKSWKIKSANIVPHITVCIKPGSKPMFSNQMLETPSPHNVEVELDQPYELDAVVMEV